MSINPVNVKPDSINKYSFARRFTRGMGTGAMLPLIALECFVTGGRTIQAYQRGGFDEARERFTEEAIGAAFRALPFNRKKRQLPVCFRPVSGGFGMLHRTLS